MMKIKAELERLPRCFERDDDAKDKAPHTIHLKTTQFAPSLFGECPKYIDVAQLVDADVKTISVRTSHMQLRSSGKTHWRRFVTTQIDLANGDMRLDLAVNALVLDNCFVGRANTSVLYEYSSGRRYVADKRRNLLIPITPNNNNKQSSNVNYRLETVPFDEVTTGDNTNCVNGLRRVFLRTDLDPVATADCIDPVHEHTIARDQYLAKQHAQAESERKASKRMADEVGISYDDYRKCCKIAKEEGL